MTKLKVGDRVTITEPWEAYGSGYAGNPEVIIQPGEFGKVGAVDVPWVWQGAAEKYGCETFICVDFVREEYAGDPRHGNNVWRIGIPEKKLRRARKVG